VPVRLEVVKAAIARESVLLLSLFLEYRWNINEEEEWCIAPLLSYVPKASSTSRFLTDHRRFAIYTNASEALIAWLLDNGAGPNVIC
jgi:hypothetical protein